MAAEFVDPQTGPFVKILYLSCHSVLEYDELLLFHEMGLDVFSHGAYSDPLNQSDGMRPEITGLPHDPKLLEIFRRTSKEQMTPELVEPFDVVIVMALPQWIENNWKVLEGKRVIWRCIGQSNPRVEERIRPFRRKGLQIVRYSPKEATLPGYAGHDAVIRFYKDPQMFAGWTGQEEAIVNFTQSMKNRGRECNFAFYKRVMRGLPHKLFGPNNETIGESWAHGSVSFERMRHELQSHRAYFYTGTYPASYTLNFIEAWMTGIPVIALGPGHGNDPEFFGSDLYEAADLISHGRDGFWSDDETELRQIFQDLLSDVAYAKAVGDQGRQKAIAIFGKETIKRQWEDFLGCYVPVLSETKTL
jgi:glycosyltransferase involved in cell wall biosynthesis